MSRIGSMYMELSARDTGLIPALDVVSAKATGVAGGMGHMTHGMSLMARQAGHSAASIAGLISPGLGAAINSITWGITSLSRSLRVAAVDAVALQTAMLGVGLLTLAVSGAAAAYSYFKKSVEEADKALQEAAENAKRAARDTADARAIIEGASAQQRAKEAGGTAPEVLAAQRASAERLQRLKDVALAEKTARDTEIRARPGQYAGATKERLEMSAFEYRQELRRAEFTESWTLEHQLADIEHAAAEAKVKEAKAAQDAVNKIEAEGLAEHARQIHENEQRMAAADAARVKAAAEAADTVLQVELGLLQDEFDAIDEAAARREAGVSAASALLGRWQAANAREAPRFQALTEIARQVSIAGAAAAERDPTVEELRTFAKQEAEAAVKTLEKLAVIANNTAGLTFCPS